MEITGNAHSWAKSNEWGKGLACQEAEQRRRIGSTRARSYNSHWSHIDLRLGLRPARPLRLRRPLPRCRLRRLYLHCPRVEYSHSLPEQAEQRRALDTLKSFS
jgi:hypothetical protein